MPVRPAALRAPRSATVLPVRQAPPSALAWLAGGPGGLQRSDGAPLRLLGLRLDADAPDLPAALADRLLAGVAPGGRCIGLPLARVAQLAPAALAALDERIAAWAGIGMYTLLRLDARLWQRGHHLRLAQRYREQPAVLYALAGRRPLAGPLWQAAQALHALHPRALVWLPLESAQAALRSPGTRGLGLLWDAARPQSPDLGGLLQYPLLLDGWNADASHPLAHQRLLALCRQGHVGWLAHSRAGWFDQRQGVVVPGRAVHALQRCIHTSA